MEDSKQDIHELRKRIVSDDSDDIEHSDGGIRTGTDQDARDMYRLGKKQEFKRNFNTFSILGFTCVSMSTWNAMIGSSSFSLIDGGMAVSTSIISEILFTAYIQGTIWVYLITLLCTMTVSASLAEMASMAPTSGGQYHWVSEFAPPSCQRFLSYIVGWLSALGWQAGVAVTAYASGVGTLWIASMNHPDYIPTQWQGTLATIAVLLIAAFVNTFGARRLPLLEGTILFLLIFGFFAFLIPLWVLAPKASASDVFTSWANYGGWPTTGTAAMVGMLTATGSLGGSDAGAHMAEEVKNASVVVPRIIMVTIVLNGVMGFVMIITFVFCITDMESMVVMSTSPYPFIEILYYATGSRAGATVLGLIMGALNLCGCLSVLAAGSRQVFAFARDGGMPFSSWFRQVRTLGVPIPLNAIFFSLAIAVIFALINLGSSTAFNSIVGLLAGSGGFSYALSIGCVLLKRIRGEPLPKSHFSLGRLGIPINAFACLYMILQAIISFFPMFAQVTPETMNWGSVVFGGVVLISLVFYAVRGRKDYKGPVVYINRD